MSDLISKAEVLETYAELFDVFDDSKEICKELCKVYDKINKLPSAEPEQRWIPVTERLPEATVSVIVTSTNGYVYTSRIVSGEWEYGGNVTAWMPLPEPYAERRTDEGHDLQAGCN